MTRPKEVLPLQIKVDLGVMGMKRFSTMPQNSMTGTLKSKGLESYSGHSLSGRGYYLFADMQPAYFSAKADWANNEKS